MNKFRSVCLLLVLSFLLILSFPVLSQTNPVTNLDTSEGFNSIQAAIDDSNTDRGDTIEVNSSTYDSADEPGGNPWDEGEALIVIDKSVTIRSTGGADLTTIDGRGLMITVAIVAEDVTIKGFTVTGAAALTDGTFATGIDASADGLTVKNNIITDNEWSGIDVYQARNCNITDNTFSNNKIISEERGGGFGINLAESDDNEVTNNTIEGNQGVGININGGSGNQVKNNQLNDNNFFGIDVSPVWNKDGSTIVKPAENNVISGNTVVGTNNIPYDWAGQGIEIEQDAKENKVVENELRENHVGIALFKADDNQVKGNLIKNNDRFGVDLTGSSNCLVQGNLIEGHSDYGVFIHSWEGTTAQKNTVEENEVYDNGVAGIFLGHYSIDNSFEDNRIKDNTVGIGSKEASGNVFHRNYIEGNKNYGALNGDSDVLNATDNYWGHSSGPSGGVVDPVTGTKANGIGDAVSANVHFDPWLGDTEYIRVENSGWSMVAPPLKLDDRDPSNVFKGVDPTTIFHYDAGKGDYITPSSGYQAKALHGTWIHLDKANVPQVFSVSGVYSGNVTITLKDPGWHQVGPPINYSWDAIGITVEGEETMTVAEQAKGPSAPHWMSRFTWDYDPEEGEYTAYEAGNSDFTVEKGKAYWVKTRVENVKLVIPHATPPPTPGTASVQQQTEGIPMSSTKADKLDIPNPPAPPKPLDQSTTDLLVTATPNPATSTDQVTFNVFGKDVNAAKVSVYDSSGKSVYESSYQKDTKLTWNTTTEDGSPVANGLYLFTVEVKRDGKVLTTDAETLLVLK